MRFRQATLRDAEGTDATRSATLLVSQPLPDLPFLRGSSCFAAPVHSAPRVQKTLLAARGLFRILLRVCLIWFCLFFCLWFLFRVCSYLRALKKNPPAHRPAVHSLLVLSRELRPGQLVVARLGPRKSTESGFQTTGKYLKQSSKQESVPKTQSNTLVQPKMVQPGVPDLHNYQVLPVQIE